MLTCGAVLTLPPPLVPPPPPHDASAADSTMTATRRGRGEYDSPMKNPAFVQHWFTNMVSLPFQRRQVTYNIERDSVLDYSRAFLINLQGDKSNTLEYTIHCNGG
jgi:hypothetical protein